MPMRVRSHYRLGVQVLMMRVVHMLVLVFDRHVRMPMRVMLGQVQPDPRCHQCAARDQRPCDGLVQQRDGNQPADERRCREIRAGARRSEMAQCQHEQHEADAVAEKAERAGSQSDRQRGQRRAGGKRDRHVDDARNESFEHRNECRIGERHLARQVVVERPEEAGAEHGQRRNPRAKRRLARPRQRHSAGNDQRHAERDPAIEILAEHEPGKERGEHALGIEQQRRCRRGQSRESPHQQHRRHDAAGQYRAGEPFPFAGCELHAFAAPKRAQHGKAGAGTEVQQPREQPGTDRPEQQLRERRAGAEQQRRSDCGEHAGVVPCIHARGKFSRRSSRTLSPSASGVSLRPECGVLPAADLAPGMSSYPDIQGPESRRTLDHVHHFRRPR